MFGVSASPLRDIHATAALLVYPIVKFYCIIVGSDVGLFLMVRCIYLVGSLLAALSLLVYLASTRIWGIAWLASLAVLLFIPFGLPAPSYNTLGLQGEVCGLAWFGMAMLASGQGDGVARPLVLSAAGFTVAALAYPTLVTVPLALFVTVAITLPHLRRLVLVHMATTLVMLTLGWAMVVLALTWPVCRQILEAQGQATGLGLSTKLTLNLNLLTAAPRFAVLCASAVIVGLSRPFLPAGLGALVMSVLLIALGALTPALFMTSHDAVFLASLMGLSLLVDLSPALPIARRRGAALYAAALVGGLTTMATTSNPGLLNFAVGGAPAAIFALLPPERSAGPRRAIASAALPVTTLLILLGWSSFTFRYGDLPSDSGQPRERLATGPFAGLAVSSDQAALIRTATAVLDNPEVAGQSIALFGRLPGLYLLSPAFPLVQRGFYLDYRSGERLIRTTHDFYRTTQPDLVAIFDDPYLPTINPMLPEFSTDYVEDVQLATPTGHLSLYRRMDNHASGRSAP